MLFKGGPWFERKKNEGELLCLPSTLSGLGCALHCPSHVCAFAGCPQVWQVSAHLPAALSDPRSLGAVLDVPFFWKPFWSQAQSPPFLFYGAPLVSFLICCNLLCINWETTNWQSVCCICPKDVVWPMPFLVFNLNKLPHWKMEGFHTSLCSGWHWKVVSVSVRLIFPRSTVGGAKQQLLPAAMCTCSLHSSSSPARAVFVTPALVACLATSPLTGWLMALDALLVRLMIAQHIGLDCMHQKKVKAVSSMY